MKKLILILVFIFITVVGYSQITIVENNITYQVTSTTANTVDAISYNTAGSNGIVNILPTVTDPSTGTIYSVTGIASGAFLNKGLTEVMIPNSVINIGNSAFRSNQLTSVAIPDSVINIDTGAFLFNTLLSNLDLGNSITTIGASAFSNNALIDITIPNSVTSIGSSAFGDNPSLISVTSEATIPPTIITGGGTDTFGDRSNIHLTIPNGTENAYIAATWINFASTTLNISDVELANNIKVITTTDAIKIIASNNVQLQNYTIYSITGAKVNTGTESEISTSFLAGGIYILNLNFDKGRLAKKVIVN